MTTLFVAAPGPVLVDREKERRHVISQHSVKLYLIPCCVIGEYNPYVCEMLPDSLRNVKLLGEYFHHKQQQAIVRHLAHRSCLVTHDT